MTVATIISKTDLARRTRQIVNQARRGGAVIVESYGEEQVAILDAADYRCLRAVAAYYAWPQQPSPATDSTLAPAVSIPTKCNGPWPRPKVTRRQPGIAC